ncbi:hypothetical protein FM038_011360 [Shewanella eurypsychrophilus]|uniref:Uncharacterized protein n=1 Tax=Shewanella eurypsychrophilus TaxID=2593656 RepID=A0ABX6V602_9GAMM|nr:MULTISPECIES: hypothetical protein [Shewanella]QFU22694.1 hypothetical protein FS418_12940 [Shewanella sp. YLB-09]QPG57983.1 hypothetical protein FM038_011360 [Shewanella eurypsychrophilus]
MDIIETFSQQKKNRVKYTVLALILWVPALLIQYYKEPIADMFAQSSLFSIYLQLFALLLQAVGMVFIFLTHKNSKCPACTKLAGSGWKIEECKSCGQKLT